MHHFRAMNTNFYTAGLSTASELQAESWFAFVEQHLSRFQPDSELSRLNAQAGYPFYASPLLYEAVKEALHFYECTDGIFNPLMGDILCQLGYDRSFDWDHISLSNTPLQQQTNAAMAYRHPPAYRRFGQTYYTLDPVLHTIHMHGDMQLDLGGIAKGWSAAQFASIVQEQGEQSGLIDAGGDLVIWGSQQRAYCVEIADPWEDRKTAASIDLVRDAGIATSSTLRRSWQGSDNRHYHHLLDPRSGTSAQSEWVQMTVISPSLTYAEVYAKCVLILGVDEGPRWLRRQTDNAVMIGFCADGSCIIDGLLSQYGQWNRQGEWTTYEQYMA
ncbi:FAD:protein FMN transferase [Paenibacillus campi]|uniref:FAD:protein FMN transferase n=1 Tax=Paenibacillus campi TaxID=3106031 RepID=UPI002AFF9717|nr:MULTISPECIES: FAD:protein FMN transferase [unclassified Paenibacillus]